MVALSVVICDATKRGWIERFGSHITPDGPTFAYSTTSMPRYWHLAVFRDQTTVFGVGVVRRGNRITDLEFKLHVAAFRSIAPALEIATVSNSLKSYSDAIHKSGVLSEARGRRLQDAICQLAPHISPILQELVAWTERQSIPGEAGEQLGMEKDAVGTLFAVAGFDRSFLTRWIDRGGNATFLDGLPEEYERPTVTSRPVTSEQVDQRQHYWVNEDQLIQFDHQRFSDWLGADASHVGWRKYVNSTGSQRIFVYYANRTPVESTLGIDLLYYHENHGCFVMVQYKKMTFEKGGLGYRPDEGLRKELKLMRKIDELCRATETRQSITEFRLLPTPCFLKLCEPQSLVVSSSEWIKGMYLAREHFESILRAPQSKGPRGGVRLSYGNVPRYLNATTFTTLVKDGWIGSRGAGTEHIKRIVHKSLTSGRAIMIGMHASDKPLGNGRSAH